MNQSTRGKAAAVAASLLLAGAAVAGTAGTASAATTSDSATTASQPNVTCYGAAFSVTLPANGYSGDFTKKSYCNDINLKITSGGGQWVAVCWVTHNNCQSNWTWVPQDGNFHVVASSVLNGTVYQFTTTEGGATRHGLDAD